jgi:hypothetical protein
MLPDPYSRYGKNVVMLMQAAVVQAIGKVFSTYKESVCRSGSIPESGNSCYYSEAGEK